MSARKRVGLATHTSGTSGSAVRKTSSVPTNVRQFVGASHSSHHQKDVLNAQTEIAASYRNAVGDLLTHHFISKRKYSDPKTSYTAFLAQANDEELSRILVDESVQLAMRYSESESYDNDEVIKEASDLFYGLLVMLERRGLSMSNITEEIVARVIDSGYETAVFEKLYNGILTEHELLDHLVKNKAGSNYKIGSNVAFGSSHVAPKKLAVSAKPKKLAVSAKPKKLAVSAKPKKLAVSAKPKKLAVSAKPKKLAVSAKPKKLAVSAKPKKLSALKKLITRSRSAR